MKPVKAGKDRPEKGIRAGENGVSIKCPLCKWRSSDESLLSVCAKAFESHLRQAHGDVVADAFVKSNGGSDGGE